ncbi:type III secretion system translocon subunit AopD [Aeromonas allosaccharophila]|uniref:type III secretion system translocon subunit AopD n=1 Tax=Aeromonas allosaccharophila TaxID=656 RepID=UPI001116400F|nr:type III secretion system translocon subunit AopD [Aeromonas allosaccharophila]TNI90777.1 AopD protein [Aeromonas allosaccharophila]
MIDNNYTNSVNHVPLLPEARVGEGQTGNLITAHEAGGSTGLPGAARNGLPVLSRPVIPFDTKEVPQMLEQLESVMDMMSLLFKLARQAREMGLVQRDTENKLVITHQKAQVEEMRHGAKLMIAMAVVSGVMAGMSAIMGGFSLNKSGKAIKQDKALNANIAGRQKELKQVADIKKTAGLEMGDAGQDLTARIKVDKASLQTLNKKFEANNSRQQVFNTVLQSGGQMGNSAVQVSQGKSQADAKEDEVKASISQAEKQKIEDNMSFNVNFMKDVLQMMQQYAQSQNQAWKAAFGVA